MRFLIMTDIEGVTGVTTYPQAENSPFGKEMLMHDLLAVIAGIRAEGHHEIVVYDMHTDGRNVDISRLPEDVQVVAGKPINGQRYRGVGGPFDGLFLVGLHAMANTAGAMLAHSYLVQYDAIFLNGQRVGEIGMERALAGEQGIPLLFVAADDKGCQEALTLDPNIVTVTLKTSLGPAEALLNTPAANQKGLERGAAAAVKRAKEITPAVTELPATVQIDFSDCAYLQAMRQLHPELFVNQNTLKFTSEGTLLSAWSDYLLKEREMVEYAQ